jgi:hypothetical protein
VLRVPVSLSARLKSSAARRFLVVGAIVGAGAYLALANHGHEPAETGVFAGKDGVLSDARSGNDGLTAVKHSASVVRGGQENRDPALRRRPGGTASWRRCRRHPRTHRLWQSLARRRRPRRRSKPRRLNRRPARPLP